MVNNHPEDGNYNVCRNVGEVPIFDVAYIRLGPVAGFVNTVINLQVPKIGAFLG
jgi:hypothetical protein